MTVEVHAAGNVLRPGAKAAFLSAATDNGPQLYSVANIERAAMPFGAYILCPTMAPCGSSSSRQAARTAGCSVTV
jgi:hypothetical protein